MRRRFRIATTDYGAVAVATPLMVRLAAVAPLAMLDVTTWTSDTLERLETGDCDIALYADSELPPDFHYRELYKESYALVLRQSHPAINSLPKRPLGFKAVLSRLTAVPRAVIMFPDGRQLVPDDVLGRLNATKPEVALRTPYFMSVPWIIAQTDLVLCVPLRVADRMVAIGGLVSIAAPPSLEPFGYRMIWHERAHRDPAQAWFRSCILEACRTLRSDKS
jgi:DNA-binding transcriptional LysR family regulator